MTPKTDLPPDGYIREDGRWVTGCGEVVGRIHPVEDCEGRACVIHNPSDHSMRSFPTHWREAGPWDVKPSHVERTCPHGIGHPDPDDLAYWASVGVTAMGIHGCDGCCGVLPSPAEGGTE